MSNPSPQAAAFAEVLVFWYASETMITDLKQKCEQASDRDYTNVKADDLYLYARMPELRQYAIEGCELALQWLSEVRTA